MKVKRPERPIDPAEWQRQMNIRLRAEFIAGAEEEWRKRNWRPMTAVELKRVLRRYPGTCRWVPWRAGVGRDSSYNPVMRRLVASALLAARARLACVLLDAGPTTV